MPVLRRGASRVSADSVSKAAKRPLPPLMATRAGELEAGAVSSMSEFHSPQEAHLPDQRGVTAPQDWQTNALEALAIGKLPADIVPDGARAEAGQHLVVDGACVTGEVMGAHIGPEELDPLAALHQGFGNAGHVDGDEVHGDAP
jgi:hypothetical protein